MNDMSRQKLRRVIDEASFAIDDVKLFLDTHPNCREALAYYQKMRNIRNQAVHEYTVKYGPVTAYNVDSADYWTWSRGPWPWEGEEC